MESIGTISNKLRVRRFRDFHHFVVSTLLSGINVRTSTTGADMLVMVMTGNGRQVDPTRL
jgi:hypothetical protein